MARIVFLVCHLTGTGHLVRTLTLAGAARQRGHNVTVLSGGRTLPHLIAAVPVIQLPPLTVPGMAFTDLRKPDGQPADPAYMACRREAIDAAMGQPDVLVTELFPLGRRALAQEFLHAIGRARSALILSSVRDTPEPKPKRLSEAADRLRAHYDGLLVHGDPELLPLSTTWPLPEDLAAKTHYTGYISRAKVTPDLPRHGNILVSVGGGVLGRHLLERAADAASRSARPWHVLVGGADADQVAAALRTTYPASNLSVEPARPDYTTLLASAGCSISLCGYNTAVELAGCRTPAILVPSDEMGQQEQTLRARAFTQFEGITTMPLASLSAGDLAATAEKLAAGPPRPLIPLDWDDGNRAVRTIETLLAERHS